MCLNNRLSKKRYHVETMSIGLQCSSTAFFISHQFEMLFWIELKCRVRTFAPEEDCPPFRARVCFRVSVGIKVGGQFSSGAIVLEP